MGPKLPDVTKEEAKQVRSVTLQEAAASAAHILTLYRPSNLGSNFSYEVTLK
jgi:hypothetical protein